MTRRLKRLMTSARPMERALARQYRKNHGLESYNPIAAAAIAARREQFAVAHDQKTRARSRVA